MPTSYEPSCLILTVLLLPLWYEFHLRNSIAILFCISSDLTILGARMVQWWDFVTSAECAGSRLICNNQKQSGV